MGERISEAKLLNKIFGNVKILNLYTISLNRIFFNTLCLNCNKSSVRRIDHIKKCPTYCKYCREQSYVKANPESVIHTLYCSFRTNAKNRNFSFDLTKEQFKEFISKNCYYCGEEPKETLTSKNRNRSNIIIKNNGIDRLDSTKGYTINNCVSCCGTCNIMKNKFSKYEFFNKIKKIYNNHLKESSTTIPSGSTLQVNGSGNGEYPN